ncbi:phage tail protein (plasmid) [Leptospira interrogans serovar Canicola]|uniref:Phage tail protein n=1 Tax=Leptospira interrogans serovar Canicola TaxID=211880 RepID=A0AAQ0B134_LEPIR|nr:phage tail protein [Leptospira interrogans]QOI45160.1 phage tail protein [Leptospira interrogans serovar Canicola]
MANTNSKFKAETVVSNELFNPAAADQATENTEFEDNDNFLSGTTGVASLAKYAGMAFGLYDLLGSPSTRRNFKKFFGDYVQISGTWSCNANTLIVNGTGGSATTEINNNELVLFPGGVIRKIKTIASSNQFTVAKELLNNYSNVVLYRLPTLSERLKSIEDLIESSKIPLGAIIEDPFDQASTTNFKEINSQAISRTTYSALWNLVNRTVASITPATDRINVNAHGCVEGQLVKFSFTGGGITALTNYYVRNPTANDFQISATATGAIIDLTSSQAGTMLVNAEYGFGDGSTTYNVPDRRGIFARGAGVHGTRNKMIGGNYDAGAVGYAGQDAIPDHAHAITYNNVLGIGGGAGGNWFNSGTTGTFYVSIAMYGPVANGANGTPRLGNETTPAYVAVKYKVRVA